MNKKYIAVRANKGRSPADDNFEIISTETWESIPDIEFTYRQTACWVQNPRIDEQGNLVVSIKAPEFFVTTLT